MGSLSNSEVQTVKFDTLSKLKTAEAKVSSSYDSIVGGASSAAGGILQGDVVGITSNAATNINAAIDTYVSDLKAHLDQVKTNADTSNAFSGRYAVGVKEFVDSVVDSCYAIITCLNDFKGKMNQVASAYESKDINLSNTIQQQGADIKSNINSGLNS